MPGVSMYISVQSCDTRIERLMSRIERKRRALGLTQRQLAEQVEVDPSTVSRWETGVCIPEPKVFPKLATVFGMTPEEVTHLFDPEPQPETTAA